MRRQRLFVLFFGQPRFLNSSFGCGRTIRLIRNTYPNCDVISLANFWDLEKDVPASSPWNRSIYLLPRGRQIRDLAGQAGISTLDTASVSAWTENTDGIYNLGDDRTRAVAMQLSAIQNATKTLQENYPDCKPDDLVLLTRSDLFLFNFPMIRVENTGYVCSNFWHSGLDDNVTFARRSHIERLQYLEVLKGHLDSSNTVSEVCTPEAIKLESLNSLGLKYDSELIAYALIRNSSIIRAWLVVFSRFATRTLSVISQKLRTFLSNLTGG